jgi:hypothetical protein
VSIQAIVAVAALNAIYLFVGGSLLWVVRGAATWIDVVRLLGLAYIVGLVLTGLTWSFLLIAGVPFSLAVVLGVPVLVAAGLLALGRARRRSVPRGARVDGGSSLVVTAVGVAAAGVLLEALFRSARLSGLYWFDGWSFWIPKAKAIYFFGGLDQQFFTELPGPSYPILVPTLDAAVFHVVGSPDVVTLHLQYWLFALGFVWALAGLLAERVPPWILWPCVLLLLVAPRIGRRFQITEADLFLDYLFVLAAVLVALWIVDDDRWRLVVAALLLCALVNTKREGLLLATVLVAAALIAMSLQWRSRWRAIGILALVTAAAAVPWRVWYVSRDVEGESGSQGLIRGDGRDLLWPSVRRSLDVLWDPGYWNLIVPLFIGALVVAVLARVGRLAVFSGVLVALVVTGGIWATWNFSQTGAGFVLGGNFVIRFMGAAALLCAAAAPLLLSAAWPATRSEPRAGASRRVGLAAAIVTLPLLAYPAITIAADGLPRFPTRDDCSRPAPADAPDVEVVYGRFDDPRSADELLARLTAVGFVGAEIAFDPCGRWKVSYDSIASFEQGEELAEQVRSAGFEASVEYRS